MDIFAVTNAHLVGIKGVAMAALAQCLDDLGIRVTGSDLAEDFVTKDVLAQRHLPIASGFSPDNVPAQCDLVVYTGAHQGRNNVEVRSAEQCGIPVMSHAEALGALLHGKKTISVCGTGGKSTTSAMLAWILDYVGARPSFAVGVGKVNNFGVSGRYTQIHSEATDEISRSGWFVVEADEYAVDPTSDHRPRFIYQDPQTVVCTNLSYDHPDIYPTFAALQKTMINFFATGERFVVLNGDSEGLYTEEVKRLPSRWFVGTKPHNDFVLHDITIESQHSTATLVYTSAQQHDYWQAQGPMTLTLKVPGVHNLLNASLALVAASSVGIKPADSLQALAQFTGTMRRFDDRGRYADMHCYDDYAHTPDEIRATLTALRAWEPGKKIIAAFQPHTYSRTKALFDGFVDSLSLADEVILLPIFASARESADPSVSSEGIGEKISKSKFQIPNIDGLAEHLRHHADAEAVLITMGAGDIYKVYDQLKMTNS